MQEIQDLQTATGNNSAIFQSINFNNTTDQDGNGDVDVIDALLNHENLTSGNATTISSLQSLTGDHADYWSSNINR